MHPPSAPWDLAGLLGVLRRRRRWILGSALVAALVALALALVSPAVYQSDVEVLVEPDVPTTTDPAMLGRVAFLDQELQTQLRLLQSEAIATRVAEALGLDTPTDELLDAVNAAVLPSTRVILLTAKDQDPDRAAELAQTFADEYLAFRREDAMERLAEAAEALEARLARAEADLARLDEEIAAADEPARVLTLRAEREAVSETVTRLDAQLSQLEASDPVARGGGRVIQHATVPEDPSEPRPVRNVAVALVLGLGLGIVLALAVDSIDDSVQTADEAEEASGRPVLGRIPLASDDEGGALPMLRHPDGTPAEAYRGLRTNLRFVGEDGPPRVVVVTSSIQGEGKSVVAANLAAAAAMAGRAVVLVDADLRRPAQNDLLGHPGGTGLSSVLVGDEEVDDVMFTVPGLGLDVLFAGERPPNPNELLGTRAMVDTIEELAQRYDMVVVDSPPVLVVPDVLEFAASADTTLLVVELRRASRREVRESTERLARANARIPGVVVNRAELDPSRYEDYYYYPAE